MTARDLHDHSRRAREAFVAVNCAALPESLVESELFGYEKAAFTGALSRKIGKFEMANRGTLFLDEIGDLPPAAQAKLLRVPQEREVQRVGGAKPVAVNVRLLAVTNQNLEACMRAGTFRNDLYYRLSVFPIRQRTAARALRGHSAARRAFRAAVRAAAAQKGTPARLGRRPTPRRVQWPGNLRELQNVVERAVILADGPVLDASLFPLPERTVLQTCNTSEARPSQVAKIGSNLTRFSAAERYAILRALELSGWRISGRAGAAEILGLKPTTLHARMKKLGIHRPSGASQDASMSASGA